MTDAFVVTCEHGGNRIPAAYRALFRGQSALLRSHCGFDVGALAMARSLAAALDARLLASTNSRLLVDLNRPAGHPRLFSMITREVPSEGRAEIISRHHDPYWAELRDFVERAVTRGQRTIHISSHSFTPVWNGRERGADVGLLYDPARHQEAELCARWKAALAERAPALRVRRNYPYRGNAAGLTTQMRRGFPADAYVGIELEINQRHVFPAERCWATLQCLLTRSLLTACAA